MKCIIFALQGTRTPDAWLCHAISENGKRSEVNAGNNRDELIAEILARVSEAGYEPVIVTEDVETNQDVLNAIHKWAEKQFFERIR